MTDQSYTVTKQAAELYKLRHPTGLYWADITIDGGYNHGRISIVSDFGNYSYYWAACGEDFKSFLSGRHIDYIAGKFGADRWFDAQATLAAFSDRIQGTADPGTKNALLAEIDNLQRHSQKAGFVAELQHCPTLIHLFEQCIDLIHGIDPGFQRLWREIWPVMLEAFKKEKEAAGG